MPGTKLTQLRSLIIDMDGVLYRLNTPLAGAAGFVQFLRETGKHFLLVTNNSTLTVAQYVAKLAGMGIPASEGDILTSAEATAQYLASMTPPGTRVYVIGEHGIRAALQKRGFVLADDSDVAYVVAGLDRRLTYDKLRAAALAIRAGAQFIGTNPDKTLPTEAGLIPGTKAILAALEVATGTPPLIIGKPEPAMLQLALQKLQAEPGTTAIIGDGLETDIAGGHRLGLTTILVLTGVTSPEQLAQSALQPDLVYPDIAALHRAWASSPKAAHRQARDKARSAT
jgi:4-nitrophenyl phosphatase